MKRLIEYIIYWFKWFFYLRFKYKKEENKHHKILKEMLSTKEGKKKLSNMLINDIEKRRNYRRCMPVQPIPDSYLDKDK